MNASRLLVFQAAMIMVALALCTFPSMGVASDVEKIKRDVKQSGDVGGGFGSDSTSCGFLTKPAVRTDGGGMNLHKGGQVLCHKGRVKHCLAHRWRDMGRCETYGNVYPNAWQIEGTDPEGPTTETGMQAPDTESTNPQNLKIGNESESSANSLIGVAPQMQQFEADLKELRKREEEINTQHQATSPNAAEQPGPQKLQAVNARRCSQLRALVAQSDLQMRQFREYSRSQRSDGQLSELVRDAYNLVQAQRNNALGELRQLGC